MSRREQVLLSIAIALFAGMLFYLFVYTPQQRTYEQLVMERDGLRSQLDRMRAVVARQEEVRAEHRRLSERIATFEAKLPTEKGIPAFLTSLEQLTFEVTTDLRGVKPGQMQAVRQPARAAAGQPAQPGQPGAGAAAADAAADAAAQPRAAQAEGPVRYFILPIEIEVNGGFAKLVTMLGRLDTFPRFVNVRALTMASQSAQQAQLRTTLSVEAYVLPKKEGN